MLHRSLRLVTLSLAVMAWAATVPAIRATQRMLEQISQTQAGS